MGTSDFEGLITFTYYNDLEKAAEFYRDIMKLDLVIDLTWSKLFKLGENAHIGLVDAEHGHHKPSNDKPVMLSFMVSDADSWYQYLNEKGIKTNHEPQESKSLHMRGFLTWDPEGYVIEILEFLTKPYG